MGAGSSARTKVAFHSVKNDSDVVEHVTKEFDECASFLASTYHDNRLRVGDSSEDAVVRADAVSYFSGKKGVAPLRSRSLTAPPPPRTERKRRERQLQRDGLHATKPSHQNGPEDAVQSPEIG